MDYGEYWGLYRDDYRDPFPHSLLSTRQFPRNLRTHILRLLGPKTILYKAFG